MPSWPAACPQFALLGLTDQRQDAVARTPMDAGPPTRRNRFTAVARSLKFPMRFTGAERATFDAFFATTIANGALSFDWTDPVSDATLTFAFRAPPEFTLTVGSDEPVDRVWETVLELEILPS